MSGVHVTSYWLGTFAWDLLNVMVPVLLSFILFAAFQIDGYTGDALGGIFLILVCEYKVHVHVCVYMCVVLCGGCQCVSGGNNQYSGSTVIAQPLVHLLFQCTYMCVCVRRKRRSVCPGHVITV